MTLLCFFHFMEFFTTAVHQPKSLSYECKFFKLICITLNAVATVTAVIYALYYFSICTNILRSCFTLF